MISIDKLSHHHPGQTRAVLKNISLEIPTGQSLALLGRSGSGKSTLLNIVSGIEALQQGKLRVAGQDMHRRTDEQRTLFRRKHIGFVYQFFNLIPTLTVAENLHLPLELNGVAHAEATTLVTRWMQRIELSDLGDSVPDKLSGGEQQRVAIARALIHSPSLLLADEPTGNLDALSGERALELLIEGATQQSQTLILVTHSLAVAARCERVISLRDGELFEGADGVAW